MARYSFVRSLCVLLVLIAPSIALSQSFPNRSLRIVVPNPPGGQVDVVARIVAKQMSLSLGQPIMIENISGSGGVSAIRSVTSSRPDGYSLIVLAAEHWAINPAARSDLPYDPEKSFTPLGMVSTASLFLAVHPSVPANDLVELVALLKQKPGAFNYGSGGIGSVHHLTVEYFKQALGLDIVHVPFRGTSQSVPALVGGQVQIALAGLNSLAPFEKSGQLKILGANTAARSAQAPGIPSMATVAPGLDFPGQVGLLGPASMPRDVVEKLAQTLDEAVKTPAVVAALNNAGVEPAPMRGADALAKRIQSDRAKYGTLIKSLGIRLE